MQVIGYCQVKVPWTNEQLRLQEVKVVHRKRNSSNYSFHCCRLSALSDPKGSHLTKPSLIPKLSIKPSLATLTLAQPSKKQILNSCYSSNLSPTTGPTGKLLHIWEKLNGSEWGISKPWRRYSVWRGRVISHSGLESFQEIKQLWWCIHRYYTLSYTLLTTLSNYRPSLYSSERLLSLMFWHCICELVSFPILWTVS